MKALHLQNLRHCVIVFLFLQKNYCTLKLQSNSRSTNKKLRIADLTKYLRDNLSQRGGIPKGRSLALLARGSEMEALHLHNLRPCVIVVCFLKKKYCILKLLNINKLSAKKTSYLPTERETYAIVLNNVDVPQMVERSLCMLACERFGDEGPASP